MKPNPGSGLALTHFCPAAPRQEPNLLAMSTKKSQDKSADSAARRARAAERLRRQGSKGAGQRTDADAARLLHELEVHQIELEMQNEELRAARASVEALAAEFTELYDFAPVGYFSLDREGTIRRVNLAGATLLGAERSALIERRFASFVALGDRTAFGAFLQRVFAGHAKESCEVALERQGHPPRHLSVEGILTEDGRECRAAALDITVHRQAEEQVRLANAEAQGQLDLSEQPRRALLSLAEDQAAAMESLRRAEERIRTLAAMSSDFFWETDAEHRMSRRLDGGKKSRVTAFLDGSHLGQRRWELPHVSPDEAGWQAHRAVLDAHLPFRDFALSRLGADGTERHMLISGDPVFDASGAFKGYIGTGTDITERKRQELHIQRLNRVLAVLSEINSAIVRIRDRGELFREVCRIAVERGGYVVAWVGLLDPDTLEVVTTACAGIDPDSLIAKANNSARADSPLGQGLVGRAIREKRAVYSNNLETELGAGSERRKEALRLGYRSLVVLPLRVEGRVVATLSLFAREAGFFTEEELRLLNELAEDVSFALYHIGQEAALRAGEEQFRGLVEQSIAGIYIIQDGKFRYVNPRFAEIFGYASAEDLIGRDGLDVVAEQDRARILEIRRSNLAGELQSSAYPFTGVKKDGSSVEIGTHASRATYRGRPAVIGLMQDISEKKRAEDQIRVYVGQLRGAFLSTVQVATSLSEMRDPYTAGHARRVGEIAVAIGAELGLDANAQEGLRVAGYLHDIGKISIPTEILSRPGGLGALEFSLIKEHAQASYDILKNVEFSWPVAEVAHQHHERMDGSGCPQGLKGEAILLESRIMAVADVVEAMASDRPYRPGLGIVKALAEIERGSGSVYDAAVAAACLKLFREKSYVIPA